jgi:hypothetical protein
MMATHWKMKGTCWKQKKNEKKSPSTQTLKENKIKAL